MSTAHDARTGDRMIRSDRRNGRTALVVLLVTALIVAGAGAAFAYFSSTTDINATGTAGTLVTPTVTATGTSGSTITVSWTAVGQLTGATYTVTRTSPSSATVCSGVAALSCPDSGLNAATTYHYTVVASYQGWQRTAPDQTGTTSTPQITSLSPQSGPVGTTVTANGNGFKASSASLTATFNGSAVTISGTTNSTGVLTGATFTVPSIATGSYVVSVKDTSNNQAATSGATNFTVAAATVTNVTSTLADGRYKAGQVVPISVTFSTAVTVSVSGGTPQLTLSTGSPATTAVNYSSGSGSTTLIFNYTVAAGNTSADLDYFSTSALTLNGGTIRDAGANNATLTLAAPAAAGSLGANKNIVIDTTAPTGSITAPSAGTIGGTVAVTSSDAADAGSGVASVQFQQKPTAGSFTTIGTVNTPGPYTVNWDTTTVANGTYVLQAIITDAAGNTTTTAQVNVTVSNTFTVSASSPQTAGTAFNVTITAKANGVTNTAYTGSHAMTFSGPANSPNGTAPTYPANVTFTAGVGTASVTLTKAATTTITATSVNLSGVSGSIVVNVGTAANLAWTSPASANGSASGTCYFTCTWNGIGRNHAWTSTVSVTDASGNIVSNVGSGHTVAFSPTGNVSPTSLVLPTSGPATTSTVTWTSPNNNGWGTANLTGSSSGFTSATITFNF